MLINKIDWQIAVTLEQAEDNYVTGTGIDNDRLALRVEPRFIITA
jgi:hypothetical protein